MRVLGVGFGVAVGFGVVGGDDARVTEELAWQHTVSVPSGYRCDSDPGGPAAASAAVSPVSISRISPNAATQAD